MVTFRAYTPNDYPQIVTLLTQLGLFDKNWESEENLSGMITIDPNAILLAVDEDVICGSLFLTPYGSKVKLIFRLGVRKSYQKQGIATKLLEYACETVKKEGCVEVALFADSTNPELLMFYKKRRFVSSSHPYYCLWREITD